MTDRTRPDSQTGSHSKVMLILEVLVVMVALTAFLALAFYQIRLPGLHTDEALEVIPAIQLLQGKKVECFKDVCINLFGLRLPVMIYEYIATVNTYMSLPFFAILGINVPALRTMPILQSAAAMIFLYLLARELYNRRVAMLTVLMLAVGPSFVFWSRQGVFVTSVTIPISLAAAWIWLRWWRSKKAVYFYLGCFLFGLGLCAKILFGWVIAGIGGAFLLLNMDRILACVRRLPQRSLTPLHIQVRWRSILIGGMIGLLLFLAGLLPVIIFNVQTQSTIDYIKQNVSQSSYYKVDNTRISENLRERIKQLRSVLNGETFWYLSIDPYASWRYPSVFLIAVGMLAFSMFGSKRQTAREMLPTWTTVAGVIVLGYVALFFLPLQKPGWYVVTLGSGLLASALSLLLARQRGWIVWGKQLAVGLGASLLFILFVYLAWKLGQWKPTDKVYVFGTLMLLAAPWLRVREEARRLLFPALVVALMLSLSIFTPTALWFTHLAIVTPWPALIIAAAADMIARNSGLDRFNLARRGVSSQNKWAAGFSLGLLGMLILAGVLIYDDLEVDVAYHKELRIIGGKGDHTSASYGLADYLQQQDIRHVVAMDMGIQDPVQFLSQGEINPVEIFGYESRSDVDPAFAIRLREQLQDPDNVYVFHITFPIFLNRWEVFQTVVAETGKTWVEEQIIRDPSTIPIFRVIRVRSS